MTDEPTAPVEIPVSALSEDALNGLIREYIITEAMGSEPGEDSLDAGITKVKGLLKKGRAKIFFDPESSAVHLSVG